MEPQAGARATLPVLGVPIDVLDGPTAVAKIGRWAEARESRVVCICNAHSVVTATRDESFMQTLRHSDMATADGAPVAWMLRRLGAQDQDRVSGPELMVDCCAAAAASGQSIFLFGSTESTLRRLQSALNARWPQLRIAGTLSPPFRDLSPDEDEAIVTVINHSGASIVWVGLGCPKQERWMVAHRGRIRAVMIGVGAAFDFHAGTIRRAPRWMREHGLEWLFRLGSEPRRLARRYITTNAAFVIGAMLQLRRRAQESSARAQS
jgi:N-acetylglucosaminyldiphosphoundecaprenol N-acetyl-beta-D-mannosaminyltransferase